MYYRQQYGFFGTGLTPGTRLLLIATCSVFLAQIILDLMSGGAFTIIFGLSRVGMRRMALWQPITYMFLHGGLWHILLNMLGLFFFGPETERFIGTTRFLKLYFFCGIAAGLGWLVLSGNQPGFCIGASGAVFGILGAFASLFPDRPVTLLLFFVLPVTMRARTLAIGLGLVNLFSMISVPGHIAYAAHIAGGLAGYGYAHFSLRRGTPVQWPDPIRWLNELRWHWQRRKFKVMPPSDPRSDFEDQPGPGEVDRILDKVAKQGIGSLTKQERETLEKASRRRR